MELYFTASLAVIADHVPQASFKVSHLDRATSKAEDVWGSAHRLKHLNVFFSQLLVDFAVR